MKRHALRFLTLAIAPALITAQTVRAETLEDAIVSGASASIVLQGWCADRGLPRLLARRVSGAQSAPGRAVRAALGAGPDERVRYRRVQLTCGALVLSEAENWYLPGRLSPVMNRQLDATQTPFGLVVAPLHFKRRTLSWVRAPDARHILEVRAVLETADGAPFSYVVEDYSRDLAPTPRR